MGSKRKYSEMVGDVNTPSDDDLPDLMRVDSCSSDEECKKSRKEDNTDRDSAETEVGSDTEPYEWSDHDSWWQDDYVFNDDDDAHRDSEEFSAANCTIPNCLLHKQDNRNSGQPCCDNIPTVAAAGHNLQVVANDDDVQVVNIIPASPEHVQEDLYDSDDVQIVGYQSPPRPTQDPFLPVVIDSSSDEDHLPDLPTEYPNQMADPDVQRLYDDMFNGT